MKCKCTVSTAAANIKFEERRSVFRILNQKKRTLERRQVDGCLIKDGIRCDWLLIDKETQTEIFIELKGLAVADAVKQITASVDKLTNNPKKKFGYVICTRCPLTTTDIQGMKKSALKTHNLVLRVKKTVHSEGIESLMGIG